MTTTDTVAAPAREPIDPDALRAKRDKRLRDDGNERYVDPAGRFGHYLDDPCVEVIEREPAGRLLPVHRPVAHLGVLRGSRVRLIT